MATRYYLRLPEPALARGNDADLAFHSVGAEGFAQELQSALSEPAFFQRWLAKQEVPDEVDPGLAATDPAASVRGEQADLHIDLVATTSLPGPVFRHRLRLLAGSHWQLRDVTAA